MAQPQRQAEFFVRPDGVVVRKAPPLPANDRFRILERDEYRCQGCGCEVLKFRARCWMALPVGAVDHIVPRSRGGQNDDANLRTLCEPCNASKGGKLDGEWKS